MPTLAGNPNTADNDILTAPDGQSYDIYGYAGNDILTGNTGHDLFNGGSGADTIVGGAGAGGDVIDFAPNPAGIDVLAYDTPPSTTAGMVLFMQPILSSFNRRDAKGDVISGVEGFILTNANDYLIAQTGFSAILGNDGNDILIGALAINQAGAGEVATGATLNGLPLTLDRLDSVEWLQGGAGDDVLVGLKGKDLLDLGPGATTIGGQAVSDNDVVGFFSPTDADPVAGQPGGPGDVILNFHSLVAATGEDDKLAFYNQNFGVAANHVFQEGVDFFTVQQGGVFNTGGNPSFIYYTDLNILYFEDATKTTHFLAQFGAGTQVTAADITSVGDPTFGMKGVFLVGPG